MATPKAVVLPHPKYCHPLRELPGTIFLHFIGFVRFQTGRYAEVARSVIDSLDASGAKAPTGIARQPTPLA